jgi:hypothetical protein
VREVNQNVQPYVFIDARADSADCLQTETSVAFVFGFSASLRQELRHCSILDLYWARAASGTLLETQASYAAINSSHSGTPIFVPAVSAFVAVAGAALLALPVVALAPFVGVSDLAHPTSTIVHTMQSNKEIFCNM